MSLPPQLPPRYQWVESVDDDGPPPQATTIPLLLPAEAERARRWACVLHGYGVADERRPPARAGARVASLPGHERLGQLVAHALGRAHHVLDPHRPLAVGDRGGSVLVVAPADALPFRVLTAIVTAFGEQDTETGFLTGRDAAGVTFSLAKLLAATGPGPGPARSGLLDGTTGLAHVLTAGESDERSTVADVLGRQWTSLIVDADGSAAHAPLGALTLCGLTGTAEHTFDGSVLPGGCRPTRCKTDPSGRIGPFALHKLTTRALGIFVCNGITLGPTEQYPSDLSLALDALEGVPQAVFGLIRGDLDTSGHEPRLAAASLHAGDRLGQCVTLLNTDGARRGIRGPSAVLLGDPEQRLHTPGATASPRPRPRTGRHVTDDQLLGTWQQRLADAHAVERGLHDSLQRRPDQDLATCLKEMAAHRGAAGELLLAAVRDHSPAETWGPALDTKSTAWAHAALSILSRTRGGAFARQLTASRAHHRTTRWSSASPCPYCHTPRETEHLTSPLGLTDRRTIRCPKCGPALSLPAALPELQVDPPAALHAGKSADIALYLPNAADGLVAVHLRPRSTRRGSYDHQVIAARPGPHTITLTMPEESIPELDRLWVVHAHRFHIGYYQQRLPGLPSSTSYGRNA
ncbi:hypothetical protein [Streptomyces prunicolor]|uniref:hypothetical protein n=1 Tax=Streptomyces prunicolor TaxID=67348 RepID=UPI0003A93C41|nr:hypothetical protein [Streptomyces prunicolor]